MHTEEQLHEIREIAKKCFAELGPLELIEPSDLYPLVAVSSDETKKTHFTKNIVLISQELTLLTKPALMPTIHLFGPENFGNFEIIQYHPSIRPISGTGIDKLKEEEDQKIRFLMRSDKETLAQVTDSYKAYLPYLREIFAITRKLSTEDIINLCYDSVFKRQNVSGSHNILDASEALSKIVLTSICRNATRSRYRIHKEERYVPLPDNKYLNEIILKDFDSLECLKDGTVNNITTFLAVYTLNAMGFPCTLEHLCLVLSTRYQHYVEDYEKYINDQYANRAEFNELRKTKPELPHIREAIRREVTAQKKREKVYPVVKRSIDILTKNKLIQKKGKRIVPTADSIKISTTNGFQDVYMPSLETIIECEKGIYAFIVKNLTFLTYCP
jgi:hypothetical protein